MKVFKDHLLEDMMYRTFIDHSDNLFTCHSIDGKFTYVSPAALPLLGYLKEELLGMNALDFCHPDDVEQLRKFICTNLHHRIIYRFRRKEGNYIWLETAGIPSDDHHELYFCISRDVTNQVITEQKLEESKEIYRLLVENFQDTVGIITKNGYWIYINDTGKKLLGVTRKEEVIGKSIFDFLDPNAHEIVRGKFLEQELKEPFELTVNRHDHQIKHVMVKLIPTVYKERETFQILIRDLTEQKKTEELMQRREKLSVVGELAAGIAHEIRNPLTVIKGFTQLFKQQEQNDYLDVVMGELERIEDIVSDLLILAKPQPSKLEKMDLKKLLVRTIDLFQPEALLHNVQLISKIELDDPIIYGMENQLKQVFINLIKNAFEAMPEGGGKVNIKAYPIDEETIKVQVTDNGIGIPDDRIPKLGEPFYSTKEKGTGLGLMICNRIIKNHRGTLEINSSVNKGTSINIFLPRKFHDHQMTDH